MGGPRDILFSFSAFFFFFGCLLCVMPLWPRPLPVTPQSFPPSPGCSRAMTAPPLPVGVRAPFSFCFQDPSLSRPFTST